MGNLAGVVNFDHMRVGKKGGGKHWTKKEVEQRQSAAQKLQRQKKKKLKMPDWLDDEAKKVWKKTLKDMSEFEILDKVDEDVLAAYCDAVARYKETSSLVSLNGYTEMNNAGVSVVSGYVKAQQSYARLILQYSDKLGLNANSRARLAKKIAEEGDDPNADLFN
ncbi:phage terminase small subunit P27 family [Brevibacillus laterosporus]|uniref:phage terminase small subunit P27 family n=1 Tax=Brevibacillus laterosporus TaxID=1465 RepID=UPI0035A69C20